MPLSTKRSVSHGLLSFRTLPVNAHYSTTILQQNGSLKAAVPPSRFWEHSAHLTFVHMISGIGFSSTAWYDSGSLIVVRDDAGYYQHAAVSIWLATNVAGAPFQQHSSRGSFAAAATWRILYNERTQVPARHKTRITRNFVYSQGFQHTPIEDETSSTSLPQIDLVYTQYAPLHYFN